MLGLIRLLFDTTSPGLSRLAMWSLIVGALTPPIVAFVQQPRWQAARWRWLRPTVMILFAALDGVVVAWLQGELTLQRFLNSALVAGVAIITSYNGVWKPSGIAPAIEVKTSARRL